jgi:hypothetical protein
VLSLMALRTSARQVTVRIPQERIETEPTGKQGDKR